VLVLHKGKLLADGSPDDIARALGGGTLEEAFLRATAVPARVPPTTTQETV
jgi:ABC-2 type transport system ATP-binding protein